MRVYNTATSYSRRLDSPAAGIIIIIITLGENCREGTGLLELSADNGSEVAWKWDFRWLVGTPD